MELSHSKALKMLQSCPDTEKLTQIRLLEMGRIDFSKSDMSPLKQGYFNLEKQGLIELRENGKYHIATFTEIGNDLALTPSEISKFGGRAASIARLFSESDSFVITSKWEVSEVVEIQELPSLNHAEVRTLLKVYEETPFYFLENQETLNLEGNFRFRKTTEGWKYCQ